MSHTTLSLVAVICFISAGCGDVCKIGNDEESWLTCPEKYALPTHRYCCESNGPLRCCDSEEYSHEHEFGVVITVIIATVLLIVPAVCYISCFCCPCCPCYRRSESYHSGFVMSSKAPAIASVEPSS